MNADFSLEHFDEQRFFKLSRLRQKRYYAYGTNKPKCACCGRTLYCRYEAHHIAGKSYHWIVILVCVNCHDTLSDWQLSWPPQISNLPSTLEIRGRFKLGFADMLELKAHLLTVNPNHEIRGSRIKAHELSQFYLLLACAVRKNGLSLLEQAYAEVKKPAKDSAGKPTGARSRSRLSQAKA